MLDCFGISVSDPNSYWIRIQLILLSGSVPNMDPGTYQLPVLETTKEH